MKLYNWGKRVKSLVRVIKDYGLYGILRIIVFNLRYFPFRQAVHLPVLFTSKVKVRNMHRGGIVLRNCVGGGFTVLFVWAQLTKNIVMTMILLSIYMELWF